MTTAALALAPLVRAGAIEPTGVVVDTITGVSGAGRAPKPTSQFCTVDEDFTAYGLLDHRHTPEIEQAHGRPGPLHAPPGPDEPGHPGHLLRPPHGPSAADRTRSAVLRRFYADEPFVVVSERSPSTKATLGANTAHLTARFDERTGWVMVLSRPRQPGQGGVRPGRAVRQPRPRPPRDDRAGRGRGVPVSVTAPAGFVAAGVAGGIKARARRPGPGGHRRRPARHRRRRLHRQLAAAAPVQVSRAHLAASGGQAAAVILNSGNANAATGAAGRAARRAHVRHDRGRRSAAGPNRCWCARPD